MYTDERNDVAEDTALPFLSMREAVLEIRRDVKDLSVSMSAMASKDEFQDHEGRLRSLERFRFSVPSAAALAAVAAIVVAVSHF